VHLFDGQLEKMSCPGGVVRLGAVLAAGVQVFSFHSPAKSPGGWTSDSTSDLVDISSSPLSVRLQSVKNGKWRNSKR